MKNNLLLVGSTMLIGFLLSGIVRVENTTEKAATTYEAADALLWAEARKTLRGIHEWDYPEVNEAQAELGQLLYFDTRLSINGEQSCNTCHDLGRYGVDKLPTSPGALPGMLGDRNSPTVLNAVLHDTQFWDGRAADLTEQAKGPILNPVEMAIPHEGILLERLKEVPAYVERFRQAFPQAEEPITYQHVAEAIAAFESQLLTPSRFDAFMEKDFAALSAQEKKGLKVFLDAGCQSCHDGVALGGQQFRRFGEMQDFRSVDSRIHEDPGLYALSGNPGDLFKFKVPSLRNIAETYPYFHDGSVHDLKESVQIMGITQLNRSFSEEELADLSAFLKSLTGELPQVLAEAPVLP
ncbi:Cpx [Nitritalea halalkaliphila LW7]|uniref:Cpx n=1 Tax=Nitritalea halalkaliphila LW7 TaxID=1189621 RepID=I5C5N2_9BACT|nr:cytochrome c peroxidase [Nitritalea halalkaliphila]EIM77134.1 Cpx [Nitritalea halalkaliphila LW7]